jgi:hypothetical protein
MRTASGIGRKSGSRRVRAAVCVLACSCAAAQAHAQSDAANANDGGEPVAVLALGPTLEAAAAEAIKPLRGLSLDVRPALPAYGLSPQAMEVGLKWRMPFGASNRVDISAWRRDPQPTDALSLIRQREPVYGARLEFRLPSTNNRFLSDLRQMGFIGLQLDNGARVGIRRSNGNPTLYYRMQF